MSAMLNFIFAGIALFGVALIMEILCVVLLSGETVTISRRGVYSMTNRRELK
jgi:hypothetical protein